MQEHGCSCLKMCLCVDKCVCEACIFYRKMPHLHIVTLAAVSGSRQAEDSEVESDDLPSRPFYQVGARLVLLVGAGVPRRLHAAFCLREVLFTHCRGQEYTTN